MNEVEAEFQTALATRRHALEQFKAEPMVASKRGSPRLSPWWRRVYKEASEVAQRWHRQLRNGKPEQNGRPYDEELDRLLDEISGRCEQSARRASRQPPAQGESRQAGRRRLH
jgi:hypothetical protein